MKLIDPIAVTDGALTTNVAETLPVYNPANVYIGGDQVRDDSTHTGYESLIGVAPVAVTISIDTPGVVTHTAHGLGDGTAVLFETAGALPTGLSADTIYYVVNRTDNSYEVAASVGGAAIDTSGTQSGTHTVISSPNKGYPLTDASKWLDLGPTNPWGMYDRKLGTLTTNADVIDTTIVVPERVTGMALFNLDAASVQVTIEDANDGLVFDRTESLVSNANVADYYDYCFAPIIRKTEARFENLPPYVNAEIRTRIFNEGSVAACGNHVIGSLRTLGVTVQGAGFGIIDGSRKEADNFETVDLVERAYRSTASLEVIVDRMMIDEVKRVMTARRAKPTVFIGTDDFDATMIYGFPRNWTVVIDQYLRAVLTTDLESLN